MNDCELIRKFEEYVERAKSTLDLLDPGNKKFDAYFFYESCQRAFEQFKKRKSDYKLSRETLIELLEGEKSS